MKLARSLLFGSAAALATVAGAQAADMPATRAAPVDFVRICSAYGAGFFYIPGTQNCLAIGGFVRAEVAIRERENDQQDLIGWLARIRLNFDVRTPTSWGLLRAYARLDGRRQSGTPFNGFGDLDPVLAGFAPNLNQIGGTRVGNTAMHVEQAFVQLGGFIAGRATTFFSPGPDGDRFFGARFDDGIDTELVGYTFGPWNGFELSLAAENAANRRINFFNIEDFAGSPGIPGGVGPAGVVLNGVAYSGQEWPDFVGRVLYSGTWGSAYVAGAVHQIKDVGVNAINAANVFLGVLRPAAGEEIGFAVNGQLEVKLPAIAAGDSVFVWGGYADGALGYIGYGPSGLGNPGDGAVPGLGLGNGIAPSALTGLPVTDAIIINGSIQTTEGFSIAAGFKHYFTPQLRTHIFGSYSEVDYSSSAARQIVAGPFAGANTGFVDFQEYIIAGNLIYSPFEGLDLGAEVLYQHLDPRGSVVVDRPIAGGGFVSTVRGEEDIIMGRLRVSRNF